MSQRDNPHELDQHAAELRGFAPDVVIDMIASSGGHGAALVRTFRGVARRTVVLSSVDAYRAAAVLHGLEAGPLEPVPRAEAIRRTVEWEGAHPPPTDAAQFDYAAEDAV